MNQLSLKRFYQIILEEEHCLPLLTPADEELLDHVEEAVNLAINKSSVVGVIQEGKDGRQAGVLEYENRVVQALKTARQTDSLSSPDSNVFGNIFNTKIKLIPEAKIGGSSICYNSKNGNGIMLSRRLEEDTENLLKSAIIKECQPSLNKLLDFISKQYPKNINQKRAVKFPLSCTLDAWTKAKELGLLENKLISLTPEFISEHYAKRGIYYIQIENSGLFYLGDNPARLPVPKFSGGVSVSLRMARSAPRMLSNVTKIVGGGVIALVEWTPQIASGYTIDNPKSIQAMILALANNQKSTKKKK